MAKKIYPALLFLLLTVAANASQLLIPMDSTQANHLKAYGIVYRILNQGGTANLLLNYRGGSFAIPYTVENEDECKAAGVSYQQVADKNYAAILSEINVAGNKMAVVNMDVAPKIAVYTPEHKNPWDDAVTLALNYAGIPYDKVYDREVLNGKLNKYTWVHIHHEDFTGQYGKFYSAYKDAAWYQQNVVIEEKLAAENGFAKVSKMKLEVCHHIRDFVAGGGYMFAMCSAPESFDMALAAEHTDICEDMYDHDIADDKAQSKLDYSQCFAFQKWQLQTNPYSFSKSNIDPGFQKSVRKSDDYFNLNVYDAKLDPAEAMLCQNHAKSVKGFMGQSTSFNKSFIKPGVFVMGQNNAEAKYIHGTYGNGMWTWYGGHDPEAYHHLVGDSATNLDKYPNSPGYRLILNNILLRATQKPVTENNQSDIQVFPNPAGTYVNVSGQLSGSHYTVFDETGKLMQSGTFESANPQLNIAQLPNGVYLLQVAGNTLKIVKEN